MKTLPDANRRHAIQRLLAITSIASSALWITACSRKPPKAAAIPPGATVLALGDSLTQGVGASAAQAYPALLAERTVSLPTLMRESLPAENGSDSEPSAPTPTLAELLLFLRL